MHARVALGCAHTAMMPARLQLYAAHDYNEMVGQNDVVAAAWKVKLEAAESLDLAAAASAVAPAASVVAARHVASFRRRQNRSRGHIPVGAIAGLSGVRHGEVTSASQGGRAPPGVVKIFGQT